jgi:hypothetical protein
MSSLRPNNQKPELDGIVLVVSCHKHLGTRLVEFGPQKDSYVDGRWKVVEVLGDPKLSSPYVWLDDRKLLIKCEDSYVHVMKKVVLAMDVLLEQFEIREGILRCGDDLVFFEDRLEAFLRGPKPGEYVGKLARGPFWTPVTSVRRDTFITQYYAEHPEDFWNPLHGLLGLERAFEDWDKIPDAGAYAGGVVVYLSKGACQALIGNLRAIDYDVLRKDPVRGFYPYIIEDVGTGYVLRGKFPLVPVDLYVDHPGDRSETALALHTNKYK